ncbi:YqgE/AlgH family protein [Brevundimonas pishanensis]|uniref:YqgE/AlgH family protein n=1 Tax=Brevundimonas pishanensis TaxID=2896315 RepID=UPI001FA6E418|nr:YqgE/AlgH family protein [Brevundimonas pishanensis]
MSAVLPPDDQTPPSSLEWPSLAGRLLVAMPGIDDERFEHAVILVCTHDDDHAMGLRLDLPAPGVDLAFVLEKLNAPTHGAVGRPVLIGGPVEQERGFVLHTDDWFSEETSLRVTGGMAVTGTREALAAMGEITGPARSTLVLGYAGWDEGQLEEELSENVWLTMDADPSLIFDEAYDTKWQRALALLGIDAGRLSSQGGTA